MSLLKMPEDSLAAHRRLLFFGAVGFVVLAAAVPLVWLLSDRGWTVPEFLLFALFLPLMTHIAYGFALSTTGFWLLRRGGDPVRINNTLPLNTRSERLPRTAIIMPVFNENVGRVFQGLRVMYESLRRTGHGDAFDIFILSDSNDPNNWIAEEKAWLALCEQVDGFGHIYYRKRRVSLHNKSGNVADFCRRWGASYRYMVVLDADSVMTGPAIVRLAHLMEAHPEAGIIQSAPQLVLGKTLFQRVIQFVSRLYGPMFAAGTNYWQLGSGNCWGHNAIIRVKPFMQHCAMPELPRSCPLGRRILSHDTVEAALMRRAGYEVWFAYDVEGSYEESPPQLLASLGRDRRWCFGNLQHAWLLGTNGFQAANRVHLLNGIMAYVSSPLWLLFLLVSTWIAFSGDQGSDVAGSPVGTTAWAGAVLFAGVMTLLFLPKVLGLALLHWDPVRRAAFGGLKKASFSVALEIVFSMLLAPVLMLHYTRFVVSALTGFSVKWRRQKRSNGDGISFGKAFLAQWGDTAFAVLWAAAVAWMSPAFLGWMVPVLIGPVLSIPFVHFTASESLGAAARRRGLFLIPEETEPPRELVEVSQPFRVPAAGLFHGTCLAGDAGFAQAVVDPFVNAIHLLFLRPKGGTPERVRQYRAGLAQRLLTQGPGSLDAAEKKVLLWDADAMTALHRRLWSSSTATLHQAWIAAFQHYCDCAGPAGLKERVDV